MAEVSLSAAPDEKASIQKIFRLTPSADKMIDNLIQYAFAAGLIKEPSSQAYILFALHCAYARLQQDFQGGSNK